MCRVSEKSEKNACIINGANVIIINENAAIEVPKLCERLKKELKEEI